MPTFGLTGLLPYSWILTADCKEAGYGVDFVLPVMGEMIKITSHCGTVGSPFSDARAGLYRKTNSLADAVLVASTQEILEIDGEGWYDFLFSPHPILPPGNYVPTLHNSGPSNMTGRYATGKTGDVLQDCVPDAYADGLEDPFGPDGTAHSEWGLGIYVTYEELKGGDEGVGARALLPILARKREPSRLRPRLGWLDRFPRLKPLKI